MSYDNPRQDRGGRLTGVHDSTTCTCGQCQWVELRAKLTATMQRQAPFVNRLTTLEADNLFAIPATFPPDIATLGAKADWLATVHLERFGDEDDSWEFERLCRGYKEKLSRGAQPSTERISTQKENDIMDDTKLEQAYEAAFKEYNDKAGVGASASRFFFWAGATFGTQLAQEIYSDSLKQDKAKGSQP